MNENLKEKAKQVTEYCGDCLYNGKKEIATKYCSECERFLCEEHYDYHQSLKSLESK